MNQNELTAEFREDKGKGASRRLRRSGKVPAVLYGGRKEPKNITLDQQVLLHQLESESFYSSILTIKIGKDSQAAILKDLQRHPAKRQILHVDLQRVLADEKIRISVPLHFLGEEAARGVKEEGGVVSHIVSEVEVSCLPKDLPEYMEIDVSDLGLDERLHLSDIKVPEGVEIIELSYGADHDQPVVAVHRPRKEEVEEELVEGEEGLEAAAEGEEPAEAKAPEEGGGEDKSEG